MADLGAGPGYFSERLARQVGDSGKVYAVDTDHDTISMLAERQPPGSPLVPVAGDPDDPRLPEPVDLVLLVNSYHHVDDRVDYFRGLAGRLTGRGRVAILEPRRRGLHRVLGHATDPSTIRREMEEAGYRLVTDPSFLPRQSFSVFEPVERDGSEGGEVPGDDLRPSP